MKRITPIPSNLGPEDQRTYRRWTGGLFASYIVAIILVIGMTFLNKPAADPDAATQMARLKTAPGPAVTSVVRQ